MTNAEMGEILREIAFFLDMEEIPFKPRAYEKAAYAIEALDTPLDEIYRRGGIKGGGGDSRVGKSIVEKLVTLIKTGKLPWLGKVIRYPQHLPAQYISGLTQKRKSARPHEALRNPVELQSRSDLKIRKEDFVLPGISL